MKIKSGFILQSLAGSHMVVPVGSRAADFKGMITLNESGKFLWQQLEQDRTEEELVAAVMEAYPETKEAIARQYVGEFVQQLKAADCLA